MVWILPKGTLERTLCRALLRCSVMSDFFDPMDCGPPGSSVFGDSPGKNTGVACHALLQGIFPTQGSNSGISHYKWLLYHLSHLSGGAFLGHCQGSRHRGQGGLLGAVWGILIERVKNTGVGSLSHLQGIFLTWELSQGLLHCRCILFRLR